MTDLLQRILFAAGVIAALVVLPGALELLLVTLGAFRRRLVSNSVAQAGFRLAAVVPAHNEENLIGASVASILSSDGTEPACEVVVVADNCTDATAERARAAGARVLGRNDAGKRGKGYALRFAFDELMPEGFDGFLIVDADSVVSTNLVREV